MKRPGKLQWHSGRTMADLLKAIHEGFYGKDHKGGRDCAKLIAHAEKEMEAYVAGEEGCLSFQPGSKMGAFIFVEDLDADPCVCAYKQAVQTTGPEQEQAIKDALRKLVVQGDSHL